MAIDSTYMNTKEAASYLRISEPWMKTLRGLGTGPEYSELSPRCIRYRKDHLDQWAEQHKKRNTINAPKKGTTDDANE